MRYSISSILCMSIFFVQAKELKELSVQFDIQSRYLKERYHTGYEALCDIIDKYHPERSVTILEIDSNTAEYTFKLVEKYAREKISCIALLTEDGYAAARKAQENRLPIAVVYPHVHRLTLDMFKQFARCEHLDIVVIHNGASLLDKFGSQCWSVLCRLGDFTLIEVPKTTGLSIRNTEPAGCEVSHNNDDDTTFVLYKTRKQGLDIARWTQKLSTTNKPRYKVESNFQKKLLYKKIASGQTRISAWKKGINLVTFVMLQGIYPPDDSMRENLQALYRQYPDHNDGVIGNMILDGIDLRLVDFGDKRRNASMKRCVKHALRLFNGDGLRLVNPEQRMKQYNQDL